MKQKTIFFKDEEHDDFSGISRKTIKIDDKYKYIRTGLLWKVIEFIVYRIIMTPFAYLYMKIKFQHKCVNKRVLKKYKRNGYFMYGNHTLMAGDAFIPHLINFPKKTYIVVHPDNVSVKVSRPIVEMCGALPLPDTLTASKNFLSAMNMRIKSGGIIQIYPEAHIWPYYIGIRNYSSASFRYPIKMNYPVFVVTNTFHKRKFSKVPKIITYIDGPFLPDLTLPPKQQELKLRDMVYSAMKSRSEKNTYQVIEYQREVKD